MDTTKDTETITVNLEDFAKTIDDDQYEMDFGDLLTLDDSDSVIDMSGLFNSMSPSTVTVTPGTTINVSSPNYSISSGTYTLGDTITLGGETQSNQLTLEGEDADLVINGRSLIDTLERLEQRMGILVPNSELESEWDELKQLGDRYRELEEQLKEKTKMWDTLKSQPAPDLEDL